MSAQARRQMTKLFSVLLFHQKVSERNYVWNMTVQIIETKIAKNEIFLFLFICKNDIWIRRQCRQGRCPIASCWNDRDCPKSLFENTGSNKTKDIIESKIAKIRKISFFVYFKKWYLKAKTVSGQGQSQEKDVPNIKFQQKFSGRTLFEIWLGRYLKPK